MARALQLPAGSGATARSMLEGAGMRLLALAGTGGEADLCGWEGVTVACA